MTYMLARSLAGHDKGQVYFVTEDAGRFVFLADGKQRTLGHPKKKNKKHIQIIKDLPEDVKEALSCGSSDADVHIKRAIKLYLSREGHKCQNQT